MNVLDLFSGIGGFSLGLERAGMRTVAFCEIDPYCRAVLRKHWPSVPCFVDVRDLHAFDVGPVDVVCGGFPCQDISSADPGGGAGLRGERSGLWSEYRRLIGECRPAWVIIENVSVLRARGLDQVLGEIASLGYDAEWHCIPASAVGAPHQRDRIWITAYRNPDRDRESALSVNAEASWMQGNVADAHSQPRLTRWIGDAIEGARRRHAGRGAVCATLADAGSEYAQGELAGSVDEEKREIEGERSPGPRRNGFGRWQVEPAVGRVADGVPSRVDRLRALGNAVVPEVPEIIGQAIMNFEQRDATGRDG